MKKTLTLLLLGFVTLSNAQQLPQYSLYMLNEALINPASLSSKTDNQITLMLRDQWTGFEDAPKTQSISYYNLNHIKLARGINILNDITGPISIINATLSGSYLIPIKDKNKLAIGGSATLMQYKIDYTQIDLEDDGLIDPAMQGSIDKVLGHSINIGAYYYNSDFFVGLSIPNIISSDLDISYDKSNNKLVNHYYLNGGMNFNLNNDYEIIPSLMIKKIGAAPMQMDLNVRAVYDNFFWGGVSYRTQDAVVVLLGLDYSDYSFAYSYDITTSNMSIPSSGSHGLLFTYKFKAIKKDSDKDGIIDAEDDCPKTAGIAKFKGCPDTDKDGIKDSEDECPTEWGLAINNGCPDTDSDGVPDKDDRCPEIPGIQELRGCPDRDGDGLQDNIDNCPDEYGPIENIGCPETEVQEKHILAVYIENILFDEAKWVLNDDAQNMLDQAAKYLLNNPNIRIRIIGHTNKIGKEGYNMKLSKRRVKAVRKYLVNEDVNEDRIEIDWKGESAPLNEPDLEKARIKNRRVEVKILNE